MIPNAIPIIPILVLLSGAALVAAYAAFRAFRGIGEPVYVEDYLPVETTAPDGSVVVVRDSIEMGERMRKARFGRGVTIATFALSTALAVTFAVLAFTMGTSHEERYQSAVWTSLANNYGVYPEVPGMKFEPGVPFVGDVQGAEAECIVNPPDLVVCNGQDVPLIIED